MANNCDDDHSDSDSDSDDSITDGVGAIVPIQQEHVHRIVSGQVISDMASAVKELVDNALDAGSTSINIRLFNQGVDVIEVSDDGRGVPKHSRPLLAMKHATSKITSFDDLYKDVVINGQIQPTQLGFRGEALFSLVQISQNLIVCTRTESETMAQQIQFTRDGYFNPKSVKDVARKVGTTVAVVKLFEKLPVRRADMIRRLKAQRAKLLKLMQAYAVLCVGVRFNVYDISGPVGSSDSKNEVRMSTTEKSKSIKETISSVFGSNFLSGLCMVKVDLSPFVEKVLSANNATANTNVNTDTDTNANTKEPNPNETKNLWRIEGMVSNAPHSNQKVAREIQFFSINGRPVDLPKISRLIAQIWRSFETSEGSKKRPACILGLYLPNSMFDVNVSPDKREVFFSHDNEMYDLFRQELHRIWSLQTDGTFAANLVEQESNNRKEIPCKLPSVEIPIGSSNTSLELPTNKHESPTEGKKRSFESPTKESQVDDTSIRPQRRMKRRNAFVRSFEKVGTATTDSYVGTTHVAFQTDRLEKSIDSIKNRTMNEIEDRVRTREEDNTSNGNLKRDDYTSPLKKMRHSERSIGDRIWNQTQLSFNSSRSKNMLEEINELKTLQRTHNSPTAATPSVATTPSSNHPEDIIEEEKKINQNIESTETRQANRVPKEDSHSSTNETENCSPSKAINSYSKLSEEEKKMNQDVRSTETRRTHHESKENSPSATNESKEDFLSAAHGTEKCSPSKVVNQYSKSISTSNDIENRANFSKILKRSIINPNKRQTSESLKSRLNRYSYKPSTTMTESSIHSETIQKTGDEQKNTQQESSTSPSISELKSPPKTTMRVTPNSIDVIESPYSAPTPKEEKAEAEKAPSETVVWHEFQNTANVVARAESAHLHIMHRRKELKQIKLSRNSSKNNNDGDNNNGQNEDGNDNLSNERGKVVKLSKEDFLTMKIIGQFNHGFILTLCENGQLWIIDQHACDEKYNFERLCRDTKIHEQTLIKPLPLELSPSEENCILENMNIFEQNGFRFHYDETGQPRNRLSLTALPHSGSGGGGQKAVQFGKEDVGALCAMLGADGASSNSIAGSGTGADGGGAMGNNAVRLHAGIGREKGGAIVRLPKAIAMFASRACRSSIMIGQPLSEIKMREVVQRLRNVDQPWTCPHGRPTIRHIRDLLDDLISDEKSSSRIVAGEIAALSQEDDFEETK